MTCHPSSELVLNFCTLSLSAGHLCFMECHHHLQILPQLSVSLTVRAAALPQFGVVPSSDKEVLHSDSRLLLKIANSAAELWGFFP